MSCISQVLVEGKASSRTAILNRPHALNAINYSVVSFFTRFSFFLSFCIFDLYPPREIGVFMLNWLLFWLQASRLMKLYKNWEDDPDIGFVVLKVICWVKSYFLFVNLLIILRWIYLYVNLFSTELFFYLRREMTGHFLLVVTLSLFIIC